jgi:RimJ/RimL family protein N-acetyltransferase
LTTDEAFKPLDLACGLEPYGSSNTYRDECITFMRKKDEEGNFCAFWKEGALVGLYLLSNDWIHTIAVHPGFQNQGLGSDMLHHAIHRLLQEKNYPEVYLNCIEINEKGLHYYKKNGFEVVGYVSEHTYRPK